MYQFGGTLEHDRWDTVAVFGLEARQLDDQARSIVEAVLGFEVADAAS